MPGWSKLPTFVSWGVLFHAECPVEGSASLRKILLYGQLKFLEPSLLINLGSTYIHVCLSKYNHDWKRVIPAQPSTLVRTTAHIIHIPRF